jgi:hypothetical protein
VGQNVWTLLPYLQPTSDLHAAGISCGIFMTNSFKANFDKPVSYGK